MSTKARTRALLDVVLVQYPEVDRVAGARSAVLKIVEEELNCMLQDALVLMQHGLRMTVQPSDIDHAWEILESKLCAAEAQLSCSEVFADIDDDAADESFALEDDAEEDDEDDGIADMLVDETGESDDDADLNAWATQGGGVARRGRQDQLGTASNLGDGLPSTQSTQASGPSDAAVASPHRTIATSLNDIVMNAVYDELGGTHPAELRYPTDFLFTSFGGMAVCSKIFDFVKARVDCNVKAIAGHAVNVACTAVAPFLTPARGGGEAPIAAGTVASAQTDRPADENISPDSVALPSSLNPSLLPSGKKVLEEAFHSLHESKACSPRAMR